MTRSPERELLRRLHGEAPAGAPAATGGREGAEEPLEALWRELEAPAAEPAPPGFGGRVMARVRTEAARPGTAFSGRFGTLPGRLAAASALSAGLVAGAGLGLLVVPADPGDGRAPAVASTTGTAAGDAPAASAAAEGLDDESLVAAAVAAAAGGDPDDPPGGLAGSFAADPELAAGYFAALSALAEEPL